MVIQRTQFPPIYYYYTLNAQKEPFWRDKWRGILQSFLIVFKGFVTVEIIALERFNQSLTSLYNPTETLYSKGIISY